MTLELLSEKYQNAVRELANNPEISATSGVDYPCTPEMVQGWLAKNRETPPDELYFVLLREGIPVGGCALKHFDWEKRSAFLGYWIGQKFWGQGLGFQGANLLRDYAFEALELDLLHALCLVDNNNRSSRILLKTGFIPDPNHEGHAARGRWGDRFPGDWWRYYIISRDTWRVITSKKSQDL